MLFLFAVMGIKSGWFSGDSVSYSGGSDGLLYEDALLEDVVRKDTDGDGVLDWEETLWGLDPTKTETTPGTKDADAVNKLRGDAEFSALGAEGTAELENLTETDKFARELFATAASLNQSGAVDQETIDKIGSALAEKVQNYAPKKTYTLLDIKISSTDDPASAKTYLASFYGVLEKNPMPSKGVVEIMEKFLGDGETPNPSVLTELEPISASLKGIVASMLQISVPESLASAHLDFINGAERVLEGLDDIQLFETDPVVAFSALANYEENAQLFSSTGNKLLTAIRQKLPKS